MIPFDGPAASLEDAAEREEQLVNEIKRLEGKNLEISRERKAESQRALSAEQQILDLGRLLVKHSIDWRKEVKWTDPTATPPKA